MKEEATDTHSKALRINLDPRWFGTFAEIGAGQEVVRWFFRVGGAAGTVAKSMSAYDMKVSDAIYGHAERYVSRGRLQAMLDREFELDVERLSQERGDNTSFFAFADTVVARSYRGTNECHGWMGIKFQSRANDEPSQVVMHVRMLDEEASGQQEALGIVGVNLCYGAFFLSHVPEELIESLLDKLTTARIEIDMLEFSGIEFRNVDNRLMALKLVQVGLSGAAMFGPNREVLQPSDMLHKKAVLVERGSFRPVTYVNIDMIGCALAKFKQDPAVADKPILALMELTMRNLLAGGTEVDRRDFLGRAEVLGACGMTVLISDYFEYHRLAAYLSWRTRERIGIVLGVPSLYELFDEKYYTQLPGGILENFGRLFKNDLKIYVYPLQRSPTDKLQTTGSVNLKSDLQLLYDYLCRRGSFVQLDNYNPEYLAIFSRDVLKRIASGDESWDAMVPPQVAEIIRRRGFFGYAGLEHDEMGHPTGSPKLHMAMTAKRRNKLRKLAEEIPVPEIHGDHEGTLMVGWGSTYGPIHDAVTLARHQGEKVGAIHLRHLHPLPNGLEKIFQKFKRIVTVEMNDQGVYGYGQLATILRARYCEPKITSFTKTDGLTFRVREILDGVFKGKSFLARYIPREGADVEHHDTAPENVKHLKEVVPQGVG